MTEVTIGDVKNIFQHVETKVNAGIAALQTARESAEDAQGLVAKVTEGSKKADVDAANAKFAEVVSGVADLIKAFEVGKDSASTIDGRL